MCRKCGVTRTIEARSGSYRARCLDCKRFNRTAPAFAIVALAIGHMKRCGHAVSITDVVTGEDYHTIARPSPLPDDPPF